MSARAHTPSGWLEGTEEGGVHVYRGVPYARAPVDALRFGAPESAPPWSGVRDARRPGPAALQRSGLSRRRTRFGAVPPAGASEDCLYSNVHVPARPKSRRPVLVWIHGGGYSHGSGSWYVYAGHRLARRGDAVVVCINYRLGAFGALDLRAFGADDAVPNAGLRDQVMALQWVRDHIEAFGGDPDNVTVFGQSAGAMSIGALLSAPAAKGLFRRAILQSGAQRNVLSPVEAQGVARALLDALGIDPQAEDVAKRLRERDAHEILRAQLRVSGGHRLPLGMLAWQPVVDGDLLPRPPGEVPPPADLDLLIGTNRDEWKMFTALDTKRRKLDADTLRGYVERTLARDGVRAEDATEAVLARYAHDPETGRTRTPADVWMALQTDRVFRIPAVDLADAHAGDGGRTYVYRFDWSPGLAPRRVGACHAMEIPFVFGTLRSVWLRPLIGLHPRTLALSDTMQDAWLSFARTGDPRSDALADWPVYGGAGADARPEAWVFGGAVPRVRALEPETRALWDGLARGASPPDARAAGA